MPLISRFFLIPFMAIWLLAPNFALPRSPLAVELISFTAVGIANGVELRWETATELSASAFKLQRGQGGGFEVLTQLVDGNGQPYFGGLVEAEGSPAVGAVYVARDLTAVPGQTYTYQLIEVESSSVETVIATTTVLAGGAPTPTQITIGNDNQTPTGSQSTATPGNTAVATASATTASVPATAAPTRVIITPTPMPVDNQVVLAAPESSGIGSSVGSSANNSQPAAPTESGILEIAQVQPTPESGYPALPTQPEAENGYPEVVVTPLTIDMTETPYPANAFLPEQQPTPTIIGVVGSQSNGNNGVVSAAGAGQGAATPTSSTAILWLGFLGGLLIFIAAIAGSIALFVRRRQQ